MSQRFSRSQTDRGEAGSSGLDGAQIQLHGRLNSIVNDVHGIKDTITLAIRACTVTALDLEEYGETTSVAEVDQSLRQLLDAQHQLEVEEKLLAKLCSGGEHKDPEIEYMKGWEKDTKKYATLNEAAKYGSNEDYRKFRQDVWEVKHEGQTMPPLFGAGEEGSDEELTIAGAKSTFKCPITTTWLVDPVTSKTCKHSFSKQAITDYLRAKHGECMCPGGGCSRRIKMADLYADKVLERNTARHLRRLEAEESSATYTVVQ
ncbi:hypothetical protein H4R27_006449 [Coemansia aciculifera]|uniref:SP-RING-type domain-containing protein n=1 Tax=Coemansia pectinata TaxID=1052879 RepID=A0A9W8H4B8_9FUNG|nr:hypothetical protein GGI19_000301 [Coemansia pectinata]KAJ2874955.1 hypothetical protein H4R27_006449 [Coemansia aciculifera]